MLGELSRAAHRQDGAPSAAINLGAQRDGASQGKNMALAKEEEQPRSGLVGTRVQGRVALFKARSRPSPPLTIAKRKEQGPRQATGKHHPTASLDWGGDPGATLPPLSRPGGGLGPAAPGRGRTNGNCAVTQGRAGRGHRQPPWGCRLITEQKLLPRGELCVGPGDAACAG